MSRQVIRNSVAALLLIAPLCGCAGSLQALRAPKRYQYGLVVVLPGIEGPSKWNRQLARGLDSGGVTSAIEIWDWTIAGAGTMIANQVNLQRNRDEAQRLADHIVAYQRKHPDAPVHLLGHSGGAGVAVFALETLPDEYPVEMAMLLAPAISPDYRLTEALAHTRRGICAFYSEEDVTLLRVGTTLFGSIDRDHGAAAGAVGFNIPEDATAEELALYDARFRQVRWSEQFEQRYGADGTHLGWTSPEFARRYLAPIIQEHEARYSVRRAVGEQ